MKTLTRIREFLKSGLSRMIFRLVVIWALCVFASLIALSFVQDVLSRGQPMEFWTIGIGTLALIGFAGFCGNPFDLGFLQPTQSVVWNRSRVSRVAVFYLVMIGWSVLLGISAHWSLSATFAALAMISAVAFGRDSSIEQDQGTISSQNLPNQQDENESDLAAFIQAETGMVDAGFDEEERIPVEIVRQVTYSLCESGTCVTAYLRHKFVANQTTDAIHLPLHPPLKNVPTADIIQLEGPDLEPRVTDCSRFGIRIEMRLDKASVEPVEVLLEINLSEAIESRLAQAG